MTAEYATIGAVVLAAAPIQDTVLGIVRDDDFTDPRCKFTIGVVRRMRAEKLPVDMVTLVGYVHHHGLLAGGPRVTLASWLSETADAAPVVASAGYYATMLVEEAARRAAQYAGRRIAAAAEDAALADLRSIVTDELTAVTAALARVGEVNV